MGKVPLKLDWDKLLSSKDNEAPIAEVEVVQSSADQALVAHLSDRQIQEKILRNCATLSSTLREKLPDKGAKLRSSIQQFQAELDRRKLAKVRKDAERSERARVSEAKDSSGLHNDSSPCTETKPQRSSFASLFIKKLEERADPAPNGGWVSVTQDKCENSRKIGRQLHEHRKPTNFSSQLARMHSRSLPFQCASSLADKDNCRITEPSPVGRSFSNSLSKRKASEINHALNPRSRKVQDVVLLDEEEVEPNQPTLGDGPNDWKEAMIYYPSRDDAQCIELSHSDIKCLDPEQYLVSPIMNFYIRYLQKPTNLLGQPKGEYHFFNTYFFKKLEEAISCKDGKDGRFLKLRRWWKGVNIFQKAYIFLPIHGDLHWSLVIICIPAKEDESGPIVLHLDSLGMHPSDSILDVVCCYLKEEWNYISKNGLPPDLPIAESIWSNLPSRIEKKKLRVPQQKNEYDCGLFVLYFMERFIYEAPERLKMKDLAMFGSKWFKPEEASDLRKRVRDLLVEEFENARLENGGEQESPTSSCSCPDDDDVQPLIEV